MPLKPGLLLVWSLLAPVARAEPLFPAGAESKGAGIESGLLSVGPPAVLYNPANLTEGNAGQGSATPYAELGMINVDYSYEHPDFDPVVVNVTSPTATFGYSHALTGRLVASGVVFPSNNGKTEIPGLPRKIGGSTMALEVENEDQVIDIGAGLAARLPHGFSLGASLVRTIEQHKTKANAAGNDNTMIDMEYGNQFTRPVVGARYAKSGVVASTLSYRPSLTKKFKGQQQLAADDAPTAPKAQGFEPETISVGSQGTLQRFTAGIEAQRQRWAKGRTIYKDGIAADEPEADLRDVTLWSVTAGYAFTPTQILSLGYADLPTPWGAGNDDGIVDHHEHGADFGQLNAVSRRLYSLSGNWDAGVGQLAWTVFHSQGVREIGGQGDNVGYYSLGVTSVSGSLGKSF